MSKTEDMLLVSRVVIADDRRAYETLMLKYQSSVRRFLLNLTLGDGALADDLAQETFIKAYLHLRSFQGLASFSSWLFRIAYNCFFDSKRASKRFDEWNFVLLWSSKWILMAYPPMLKKISYSIYIVILYFSINIMLEIFTGNYYRY